jgi:hypothetical protein
MWSALFNSHLYLTVTSIQQSPVNLTMWSLLFNSHLYSTITCIQQSSLFNSHLYSTVTSIQQSHLFNSHLYYNYFLLIKIRNYWYMYIFIQVKEESFNCCSAFQSTMSKSHALKWVWNGPIYIKSAVEYKCCIWASLSFWCYLVYL